jgi:hypothetical protein
VDLQCIFKVVMKAILVFHQFLPFFRETQYRKAEFSLFGRNP